MSNSRKLNTYGGTSSEIVDCVGLRATANLGRCRSRPGANAGGRWCVRGPSDPVRRRQRALKGSVDLHRLE